MRPVRILLIVVALLAVAVTGWALAGGDGYRYGTSEATPAHPGRQAEPAAPVDPAPATRPAPRPTPPPRPGRGSPASAASRSTPGGRLLAAARRPGLAILISDAEHATRVEFLLTPTGTGGDLAAVGQDRMAATAGVQLAVPNEPLLAT